MYCSMTWVKASTRPLASWRWGIEATTVGSDMENCGNSPGPPIPRFCPISLRLTTAPLFISEPVAGKVNTVPKGNAFVVRIPFARMSQGSSPSKSAAEARNFVPSITEPPPTASKKSIFSAFIMANARSKVLYCGLGSMPPNSKTSWFFSAPLTFS